MALADLAAMAKPAAKGKAKSTVVDVELPVVAPQCVALCGAIAAAKDAKAAKDAAIADIMPQARAAAIERGKVCIRINGCLEYVCNPPHYTCGVSDVALVQKLQDALGVGYSTLFERRFSIKGFDPRKLSAEVLAALKAAGGTVVWQDVPTPEPGPGQVRVRTGACAICATDLSMIAGGHVPASPRSQATSGQAQSTRSGTGWTRPWLGSAVWPRTYWPAGVRSGSSTQADTESIWLPKHRSSRYCHTVSL